MDVKKGDPKREQEDKVSSARYLLDMIEKYGVSIRSEEKNQESDNGDLWIPLFLSEEELGKGDTANITMPVYIYDLLNFGLNDDSVKGVIVNPFGKFYPLGKDILRTFIEKCEEWAAEDGIEIPRADAR